MKQRKTLARLMAMASFGMVAAAQAQNARVQVIHNCADAAAAVVDVYVNGGVEPAIPDFAFRTATPFIDLPAGVELEIGIAPGNSTGPQDIIPGLTFTYTLADGETYVLVANGIVSASGYTPAPAFDLNVFAPGREAASTTGNTDILVLHGSTDAPEVQVAELDVLGGAVVVPAFSYGDFSADYLEVPAVDLTLQVQLPDGTPVKTYSAPLAGLGLADAALVAVASGFLDPSVNSNGPEFGIWVALPSGGEMVELPAATARVQVIHNSADAAASVVDVYLNGGAEPAIPDFAFRTATPFIDLPAGVELEIGIAPGTSAGPQDIIPGATFNFTLANGETYVLVANGIVSASGYTPAPAFDLNVFAPGREAAATTGNTDILVVHGSTDAPDVQVAELDVLAGAVVVPTFGYGDFSTDYLEVPAVNLTLQVQLPSGAPVATYSAPLADLGLADAALVAVASGFLDPSVNSDGPAFGIWVALPTGGNMIELPAATARVQVIHNSADAAASVVDVYLNGGAEPAIPDFAFRTATPFIDLPAGVELEIGVAPGTSAGPQDIIPGATFNFTLTNGETYVLVANGIVSATGYTPAPAFDLNVFAPGREAAATTGNTDILVVHGSTDAPDVQVAELDVLAGAVVVPTFGYGDFSTDYLEVPAVNLTLQVQLPSGAPVATYSAPLADLGLADAALVAVASGFLDPSVNSDGPAFGIWVALPTGGNMIELPAATARVQVIHNSADAAASVVDVYLNGGAEPAIPDFAFRTATPFIDLPAGVELEIGVAPGTSAGPQDIIPGATFNFTLTNGETYVLVANGIVSATGYTPAPAFDLNVFAPGREAAATTGNTDILVVHGSTDAPDVQVAELAVLGGTVVVPTFGYGDFSADYLEVPAVNLALQVQLPSGAPVATYSAPLADLGLADAALVAVASGFLNPANNSNGPAFGIWVALPAGGEMVELPLITNVGIEEADEALTVTAWPNPTNDVLNVSVDATEQREVTALVTDMTGRVVLEVPSTVINLGENRLQINTAGLSNGMYTLSVVGNAGKQVMAVQVAR